MRPGHLRVSADVVIAVAIFFVAAATYLRATETAPFHGDESEWINASRYFKYLFLDGDVDGQVWRPSFITRDQPPLGRYVIGAVVWALGNDPLAVNRSYAWDKDRDTNQREGRVPGPHLLDPVRRTMAIIGAASIVVLYVAGRILEGPITGAVGALFVIVSPLVQQYFAQARTESLLALFSGLALIGVLAAARRFHADGEVGRLTWLTGVALGLALATKLTAALAVLGTGAYAVLAVLSRQSHSLPEARRIVIWTALGLGLTVAVWVGSNPFLWGDPIGRTYSMLVQQQRIMEEQGVEFGGAAGADPLHRARLVVERTFVENGTPTFDLGLPPGGPPVFEPTFLNVPGPAGISLELALAVVGFAALLWRAVASWRSGNRPGVETAFLCWLAAYFAGIAANLSLDWPRYYVPTAYFGSLLIGLGVAMIYRAVATFARDPSALRGGGHAGVGPGRTRGQPAR
jgi:4-amino-4-deoxy-L-arabinose transferase-like glycosyltransferase